MENYWKDYKSLNIQTWIDEFGEYQLNLNELKEYLEFIEKSVQEYDETRYSEKHHILPRCVDKSHKFEQETLRINGANHFESHSKLVNCFNNKYFKYKLSCAILRMKGKDDILPGEYEVAKKNFYDFVKKEGIPEEIRKRMSDSAKVKVFTEEHRKNIGNATSKLYQNPEYRKRMSVAISKALNKAEVKQKLIEASSGVNNPMYGKKHSEESKRKMSEKAINRCSDPQVRVNMSNRTKEYHANLSEKEKANRSYKHSKEFLSEDTIRKMSESHSKYLIENPDKRNGFGSYGKENPCYGRVWMNNDVENKYVKKDSKEYFALFDQGYKLGRLTPWQ